MRLVLGHLLACFLFLGNLAAEPSCQEALALIDRGAEDIEQPVYLDAAAILLNSKCREFMMGPETSDQVAFYKANVAHLGGRLRVLALKMDPLKSDGLTRATLQTLFNTAILQIEANDQPTLGYADSFAENVREQTLGRLSKTKGKGERPAKKKSPPPLPKNAPPLKHGLVRELLDLYRIISGIHHTEFSLALQSETLSGELAILGSIEGARVEGLGKLSAALKAYGGKIGKEEGDTFVVNELERIEERERLLTKDLGASESTIKLRGKDSVTIPCADLLVSDFLLNKVKASDLGPSCFELMPFSTFQSVFSLPKEAEELQNSVWESMGKKHLKFLYKRKLLRKVSSAKLNLIGTKDPTVCNVFDDPSLIASIPNMTNLGPKCVAASDSWGLLVGHMGSKAGDKVLTHISGDQLADIDNDIGVWVNVGTLGGTELTPRQWQNMGAEDDTFCESLTADILELLPELARNLSKCIKTRPQLIKALSESEQRMYLGALRDAPAVKDGTLDEGTMRVAVSVGTASEVEGIIKGAPAPEGKGTKEVPVLCNTYAAVIDSASTSVFTRLRRVCGNAGFDKINDDQLQSLRGDCGSLDVDDVSSIGTERFFGGLDESCAKRLEPDIVSFLPAYPDTLKQVIPTFSDKQLRALPEEIIKENEDLLTKAQKTKLAAAAA